MYPIDTSRLSPRVFSRLSGKPNVTANAGGRKDVIEISEASKAFAGLDRFLNLSTPGRVEVDTLNPSEKEEFLKMLSELLKRGVVGYEVLEVNGLPEKHYIVNQIGDHRLRGAKIYKKQFIL
jgi:hypothetical protein